MGHSLFLCEDGSVYASGKGLWGRLGDGRSDDHYEGTPIQINKPSDKSDRFIINKPSDKSDRFIIDTSNIKGKR